MSRLQELIERYCPDGVEYKKLVTVADVLYGAAFKSALFNTDGDGLPVIRIRDVLRGYSETFYSGEYEEKYVIHDGDMLLGMDGNFNLQVWSGGMALLNQRVCRISTKDAAVVLNGFLCYWLQPVFKSYEEDISRTTVAHMSARVINSIRIPVPPVEIQREVVRILDEYTAAHDELVRQLEEEMRLREQQLLFAQQDLVSFGGKVTYAPIGELADVSSGATPSRKNRSNFIGTIPWVKTGEVASGDITETEEHISDEALASTACKMYQPGTVLIAMYGQGDTRGKASMLKISATTNQACAALVFHDGVNPEFALRQIQLRYEELRELSNKGGGQSNLSLGIIKRFTLAVPDLDVQREFVARYDDLKRRGISDLLDAMANEVKLHKTQLTLVRNQLLSFPEKVS